MTTTAEKIAIMRAHIAGVPIESASEYGEYVWYKCSDPCWNWDKYGYRIAKPIPKVRKVKLYAYLGAYLIWHTSNTLDINTELKRIPKEDKIIEVEE